SGEPREDRKRLGLTPMLERMETELPALGLSTSQKISRHYRPDAFEKSCKSHLSERSVHSVAPLTNFLQKNYPPAPSCFKCSPHGRLQTSEIPSGQDSTYRVFERCRSGIGGPQARDFHLI